MEEDSRYGRGSQRKPELTEDDRARIRAEEEEAFRAKVRAGLSERPVQPHVPVWVIGGGVALAAIAAFLLWPKLPAAPVQQSSTPQLADASPKAVPAEASLTSLSAPMIRELCAANIRDQLKAPATAQFNDPANPTLAGASWLWESHVDAQNSYGALIRSPLRCKVTGTSTTDAVILAELADEKGQYPSDKAALADQNEKEAAAEATRAINLCVERLRVKYPSNESRRLLMSCFGSDGLISIDEEANFQHIYSLDIDTGLDGDELRIDAESAGLDDDDPGHLWRWEAGKIEQLY